MAAPASPFDHLVKQLGLRGRAGAAFKTIIGRSFELKPRRALHHYTTAGGLRAILPLEARLEILANMKERKSAHNEMSKNEVEQVVKDRRARDGIGKFARR